MELLCEENRKIVESVGAWRFALLSSGDECSGETVEKEWKEVSRAGYSGMSGMAGPIEEVLSELGWSEGFRIPIANEENKRLEEEIEQKRRQRASLKTQLEAALERLGEIRRHTADVRQEQRQNQRLLCAQSSQVETENHLYKVAQLEESRLQQEMKQREKESRESGERIARLEENLERLSKKLESSRKSIELEQDRLRAWEEKLNRKEEKNMVIEQFVKADEKTFKKVELERQSLSEKAEVYRQAVIKSVGDVKELEFTLDRTVRLYGQAVKDRRQLMDQWSQSVDVLTQRDKSIYQSLQEINLLREIAKERMDTYQEAERFLSMQNGENRELEDSIKYLEKKLVSSRAESQRLLELAEQYSIQLHVGKKQLQDLARRVEETRGNCKRKRSEILSKKLKLEETVKASEELKESLQNIDGQKMNVEGRRKQVQDMLEKEDRRKATIAKEIKRQQALILRASSRLKELEGERKVVLLRQQAESRRSEHLLAERLRREQTLKERNESVYQTDVELQRCEMRLQNLLGQGRNKEEYEAKQARLKHLQKCLKSRKDTLKIMHSQLAQLENEIRKVSTAITSNNEEMQRMKSKQCELLTKIEGGQKQLRAAQSRYEERQVEESIMELRVKEAEKIASRVDDKLCDLEKYAIQMEAAAMERKSQLKAQKDSLNLQRRLILNDCMELRNMISERKIRVQQLQARFEIQTASLGTNPEDGTPLTISYLVIQSAQERYLLKERGDLLDRTVRKVEQEIQSMENTLRLVNVCNDKFRSSLSEVDDYGPEKAEQRRLDEELYNALELVRLKREKLERAQEDYKRMEANCEQLDKDIQRIKEEKESKQQIVTNLEHQITEQKEKLARADKNLRQVLKEIQKKCICSSESSVLLQERDIAVRELQEQNMLALQRIAEFTIRHLEAESYVKKLLTERNIELPCAYYLRQATPLSSSRCDSVVSTCTAKSSSRPGYPKRVSSRESLALGPSHFHFQPNFASGEPLKSNRSSVGTHSKKINRNK